MSVLGKFFGTLSASKNILGQLGPALEDAKEVLAVLDTFEGNTDFQNLLTNVPALASGWPKVSGALKEIEGAITEGETLLSVL